MITALVIGSTNLGSNSELGVDLAFGVACAIWGYHISRRHRIVRGVTPWRLPSIAWAIICLLLQPFGIIMELVAEFTTRPVLPTPSGEPVSEFRSFPPPVPTQTGEVETAAVIETATSKFPAPNDGSGKVALFGWYADPNKQHEHRYWDGRYWSDQVADQGTISSDPLPS